MRRTTSLSGLGTLAAVFSALTATSHAYNFVSLPSPDLDLSALGRVAVVGDFDSISVAQYQEQSQSGFSTNGSQSLLARYPDGAFANLATSDGIIEAMCPFVTADGTFEGVVVGGNFTSLGGIQAQGVALFNPNTSVITPLPGISGSIASIYCDQDASTVYFGGSFSGANSTNAIAWVTGWTNLPFAGFNGPVYSVTKSPSGNIVFAGDFDGLGNVSTPTGSDNLQIVALGSGNLTSESASNLTGFSDPSNIVCKDFSQQGSGQTFLLEDDSTGYWDAKVGFGFIPTTLRMYNTDYDGRGTKTFRLVALPINGIMNLTYTDSTGTLQSCTANCPLPQNNLTMQEFTFVNQVGMNEVRIEFIDWYGSGAGLNGIELLQSDLYSYAVADFNSPSCDSTGYAANATSTGPWVQTPSGTSDSDYLTASIESGTISADTAYVVFEPDVKESGNYTIEMYTPGCIGDDTCKTRGSANVTGTLTSNGDSISTIVTQTNDYDKYDQIYYGPVDVTSDSFRPTVTLSAMTGQDVPLTLVAQRIRFVLVDSTGGLNGLYEYNPSEATVSNDFSNSAIDQAGMDLASNAVVNALAVADDTLFIGGNFSSGGSVADLNNIFFIGPDNATAVANNGLNDAVEVMYANGTTLYVGGNFTATYDNSVKDLNGLAVYSSSNKAWSALGAGVNGTVSSIVPLQVNVTSGNLQDALAISGTFSSVNAFGSNSSFTAGGIAIWLVTSGNWLHNVESGMSTMQGTLSAYTTIPDNSSLWAGSVSSQNMATTDAVALSGSGEPTLVALGLALDDNDTISQADSSSMLIGANITGAVAGLFIDNSNYNVTAVGGHFAANTSSGTIYNFALISGSSSSNITGLPTTIYANSTVLSMDYKDSDLYMGGVISGTTGSNTVGGFMIWDLSTNALADTQPPALNGDTVIVNSVVLQPGTSNVYVGGNFTTAGSLGCETLCMWSATSAQWMATGTDLSGVVTSMVWASNTKLILAGNMTVGGNHTYVASYDSTTQTFSSFTGADGLPGPATQVTPASSDYNQFWAVGTATNGSSYLHHYNGSSWSALTGMGSVSTIRSAQVMSTTSSHDSSAYLTHSEVLLITGTIDVDGFGNASAVLFNGTTYTPFLLANTADNGQGSIARMFVQYPAAFMNSTGSHLARGFVVLIALAIALALIFLLLVFGILLERYRRKREGYVPIKQLSTAQQANLGRIPPERLFGSIGEKGAMAPKI